MQTRCPHLSPWRNRSARSAVNRKVGGSSPPGDDLFKENKILLASNPIAALNFDNKKTFRERKYYFSQVSGLEPLKIRR